MKDILVVNDFMYKLLDINVTNGNLKMLMYFQLLNKSQMDFFIKLTPTGKVKL